MVQSIPSFCLHEVTRPSGLTIDVSVMISSHSPQQKNNKCETQFLIQMEIYFILTAYLYKPHSQKQSSTFHRSTQ